ncbi:MAG: hypothetical protein ACHP7I_04725 [Terriglobales bacterium]
MNNNASIEKKLDDVIELLQHLLALELSQRGVTQELIGKHLHIAKAKVGVLLRDVKKEDQLS